MVFEGVGEQDVDYVAGVHVAEFVEGAEVSTTNEPHILLHHDDAGQGRVPRVIQLQTELPEHEFEHKPLHLAIPQPTDNCPRVWLTNFYAEVRLPLLCFLVLVVS